MEFSNQYLTYEEYKRLGGTINLMPFNLLEFESRRKIDNRTQNRLENAETIPQEVKMCEYLMINKMSEYDEKLDKINSSFIKSENIDGYSVSYSTDSEVAQILKNKQQELEDIMEDMLMNVIVNNEHIMYLGVK